MRTIARILVFAALVVTINAQDSGLRWEATGGPLIGHPRQIISQRGRLLLLGGNSAWWRSRDRGVTWDRVTALTNGPWVIGGDGQDLFGGARDGVVRSSDMGDSWDPCGALPVNPAVGNEVAGIAGDKDRVYASVAKIGVFLSENRCRTWRLLAAPWKLDIPPRLEIPPKIVYVEGARVIVSGSGGVFTSNDAGGTWTPLAHGMQDSAFAKGCRGDILAGANDAVFQSRDGGRSWAKIGSPIFRVRAIAAPRCGELFAAVQDPGRWTYSVVRSTDGGTTWTSSSDGLTGHQISTLSVGEGDSVYVISTSGAFLWSRDGRWQPIGPADTSVESLVATPWGDVLAATTGLGGLSRAKGGAGPWRLLQVGHQAHLTGHVPNTGASAQAVAMTSPGDILVSTSNQNLRSSDRGETWSRIALRPRARAYLSTKAGAILAGTERGVFRSTNAGDDWVERSIGLSDFRIYSFTAAPDGTVYTGTAEGGVFRSTDEGDQWRPLPVLRGRRPVRALLALRNGHLLAGDHSGVSRWDPTTKAWTPIPSTFEPRPTSVRALIQDAHGTVFAGSETGGVFASYDEGATWIAASSGLTTNQVLSLTLDGSGSLIAGTSAGVFRARIVRPTLAW